MAMKAGTENEMVVLSERHTFELWAQGAICSIIFTMRKRTGVCSDAQLKLYGENIF